MKRIAFYLESTEATGGVNRVVSMIAMALAARGYDVHLVSRYGGRHGRFITDSSGITFHELFRRFHSKYLTAPIEAVRLRRIVKAGNIDIVVSASPSFWAIARHSPARHVVWDHVSFWFGNPVRRYHRRLAARRAEALVTLTEMSHHGFDELRGVRAHIVTIHNPATATSAVRAEMASRQIVSLGVLTWHKGYDLLVEAWAMIDPSLRAQWRVVIAGDDEGEGAHLVAMMAERGVTGIDLVGYCGDVGGLLAQSSIYVLTSRGEGMPMSLLEAQAAGLPIVSFDCRTGPAEILRAGLDFPALAPECGVLVEPENPAKLARALETVMRDEALRERMSAAALENVQRFDLSGIVDQWEKLFNG